MSQERFTLRAAVYLLPIKNGKVLLSRRFNTGWMDGNYSLVAGHIDGNESVFRAMIREAYEEVGIKILKKNLIPVKVMHRYSSDQEYMDFFFITKVWKGTPEIKEKNKCDELKWFSTNELPKNTLPHVKEVIKTYKDKVSFIEFGWN